MISSIGRSAAQSYFLQALQDKYASTDTNGDGSLSFAEFKAGASQDPAAGPQQLLQNLFSNLDSNGDGSLSQNEFVSGLQSANKPPPSSNLSGGVLQQLAQLFQNVDRNGDGSLTLKEFKAGTIVKGQLSQQDIFNKIDTNGDGNISKDEFTTAFSSYGPGQAGSPPPGTPPIGGDSDGDGDVDGGSLSLDKDGENKLSKILSNFVDITKGASNKDRLTATQDTIKSLLSLFDQDQNGILTQKEAKAGLNSLRKATLSYLISQQSASANNSSSNATTTA